MWHNEELIINYSYLKKKNKHQKCTTNLSGMNKLLQHRFMYFLPQFIRNTKTYTNINNSFDKNETQNSAGK